MSKQDVENFFQYVQNDCKLKEKITTIVQNTSGKKAEEIEKTIESGLIPLADENGFKFTIQDYKEFIHEMNQPAQETSGMKSLDLDDLDNVSGGSNYDSLLCQILTAFLNR